MDSSIHTIPDLLSPYFRDTPGAPALLAPGRAAMTYAELQSLITRAGKELGRLGLGAGDRLALVLPNGPEMAGVLLAALSHAACAPLNPRYRRHEFEFYLSDLKAKAIVVPAEGAPEAEAAAHSLGMPLLCLRPEEDGPAGLFRLDGSACAAASRSAKPPSPDDVALLLHTSGTTARPKLVPLTQRNLYASARNVIAALLLGSGDRCLNIMPLFHIHGIVAAVLSTLASGGSIVCTDGVYAASFFDWMDKFQPTWYTAVPAMHQSIVGRGSQWRERGWTSPLRFIRSSSAPLPPVVLEELEQRFAMPVVEAYGMTEAAHQMASNPLPPAARKPGSVGPAAGPQIAIMSRDGRLLEAGLEGEVVIRGENVTAGYEANEEANRASFRHGWFRTGDLGRFDEDGYLYLLGRIKEQINRGGEKISPREIDEVLLRHPSVAHSLAFSVPHKQLGEEVGAAVVLKAGAVTSEAEVRAFAANELAAFKVPRVLRFLDEIPKGPTGKPQRIGMAERLGIAPVDEVEGAPEYVAPRSEIESRLAGMWEQMLRTHRVGVRDRFTALGGDSLLAARMMAAVGEAFETDSALVSFLEDGTIESLARDLEAALAGVSTGLATLSREGAAPPLFCAPGHDGSLLPLKRLADRLGGNRALYAANYAAYAKSGERGVESLARAWVADIRGTPRDGRRLLLGHCFGALVALEAARLLWRGETAAPLLVLVDSLNPAWPASEGLAAIARALARQLRHKTGYHFRALARMRAAACLSYLAGRTAAFASNYREWYAAHRAPEPSKQVGSRTSQRLLLRGSALRYRPAPYEGPVVLLKMKGRRLDAPRLGWGGVLRGSVEEVELPFHPDGVLGRETAGLAAAAIAARLPGAGGGC